jgi:hypothetical protein
VATKEYLVIGGCGKRPKVIRKTKDDTIKASSDVSNAGWVTFVSLRPELNFAQVKSMYLPFALKSLHYVSWEGMDLVLVMNASLHRNKRRVLAIRMDAGLSPIPCNPPSTRLTQYSSFAEMLGQTQSSQQSNFDDSSGVKIRRFECFSVRMDPLYPQSLVAGNPFDSNSATKLCSLAELNVSNQSSPPGIIAVYSCSKLPSENDVYVELQSFQPLEISVDKHVVLPVKRLHGHVAMIEYTNEIKSIESPSTSNNVSLVGCVSGRVSFTNKIRSYR